MEKIIYTALVALVGVSFFVGKGCGGDPALQALFDATRDSVQTLNQEIDSIAIQYAKVQDSLFVARADINEADHNRRAERWRRIQAEKKLRETPRYDSLSHDDLAIRADSVFRAGTISPPDSLG